MPNQSLQVLQLRPGVNREGTSYAGEGGWYSCDKIRFRSGLPEKLGGWGQYGVGTYTGICRHYTEWVTLSNFYMLGVGTNSNYYILSGSQYYDITPISSELPILLTNSNPVYSMFGTLGASITAETTIIPLNELANECNFDLLTPFIVKIDDEYIFVPSVDATSTNLGTSAAPCIRGYKGTPAAAHTSGSSVSSSWVLINAPINQAFAGGSVFFTGMSAFADLLTTEVGDYLVTETGDFIASSSSATTPYTPALINRTEGWIVTAASANWIAIDTGIQSPNAARGGGSAMYISYGLVAGSVFAGVTNGWGAGPWIGTPFSEAHAWNRPYTLYANLSDIQQYQIRLWSGSNYGENLYFNPRNFGIYVWNAATQLDPNTGVVTGRGTNIKDQSVAGVTLDQMVVGNYYQIVDLGGAVYDPAVQTKWNTIAGTTGITYDVASTLFCADVVAGTGSVVDPAIPSVSAFVIVTDERHVVAFGCNDAANGSTIQDPMFIAWCSQEQPQVWWPTITNTAGSNRVSYGSKLVTAVKTRQEILVWTDTALFSMQYLGAPYIYGFTPLSVDITIVSPNAAVTTNGITYWMGEDKFYAYSGRVDTLPCSLRQYVFDDINAEQFAQVYAGTNEKYNEVWWFYPSKDSNINDRYVIYNYLEKLWYYGQLSRTAWLDSHIIGNPVAAVPNITDIYAPYGLTVQHEVGTDDGSVNPIQPITAYIESSDFDLGDGGYQFSFVKRVIPDVDFIGSQVSAPSVTMTLKARNYPGVGVITDSMQDASLAVDGREVSTQVYNYTPEVWLRIRGRQLIFRIESDQLGVKWQLGSPRLQIQPDGRR